LTPAENAARLVKLLGFFSNPRGHFKKQSGSWSNVSEDPTQLPSFGSASLIGKNCAIRHANLFSLSDSGSCYLLAFGMALPKCLSALRGLLLLRVVGLAIFAVDDSLDGHRLCYCAENLQNVSRSSTQ
jgi:hypothetical protein